MFGAGTSVPRLTPHKIVCLCIRHMAMVREQSRRIVPYAQFRYGYKYMNYNIYHAVVVCA